LVALQVNNISAKDLNKSNIEALAEKIVKSESGINYLAIQTVNAMSLIGSFATMTENERLMAKEKFENFGKLNNQEFTPELKEEFAKLRGFYDYDSYQNLRVMRTTSLQRLVSDFPEINTMSLSDRVLLFETVAQKFDYSIFSSPEFLGKIDTACLIKALKKYAKCVTPKDTDITVLENFLGCIIRSEAVETMATDGEILVAEGIILSLDTSLCGWLFGLKITHKAVCTEPLLVDLKKCIVK
jgi:hypothetical protein